MKLVPWPVYVWACKRFGLCWASCVDLKQNGLAAFLREEKTLRPTVTCFRAHPRAYDYCGQHDETHPLCVEAQQQIDGAAMREQP